MMGTAELGNIVPGSALAQPREPAHAASARPPRPSSQRTPRGPSRRPALLIVDDERDIRDSLLDYFAVMLPDVDVAVASDGEEALEIAASQEVDVVVSDYKMPGMDGIRLLEELRKNDPGLPCILITAFPEPEIRTRAREDAHVDGFFAKPVDVDALLTAVKSHLH